MQYLFKVSLFGKQKFEPLDIAAFYSGKDQYDAKNKKYYKTENENKVIWSCLFPPGKETPYWVHVPVYLKFQKDKKDLINNARNVFWNSINTIETRPDSQFARFIEIEIPSFLKDQEKIDLMEKFIKNFTDLGMIVDASIHGSEFNKLNYNGYILCSLRNLNFGIFENKNREWNSRSNFQKWRETWAILLENAINLSEASIAEKEHWKKNLITLTEEKNTTNKNLSFKNNI